MKYKNPYPHIKTEPGRFAVRRNAPACFILLCFIIISRMEVAAQIAYAGVNHSALKTESYHTENDSTKIDYDEIMILLYVPRIGSIEIPAVIAGETAFLPVKELFDFLKIKNTPAENRCAIEGFFIEPAAVYSIDRSLHQISYQGRIYNLPPADIICNESGLFLKSDYFGKIFGLDCQFSFRSLSVNLITSIELPVLREMKLEAMHKNLTQLNGDRKADTAIGRKFSAFRLGMIDWSLLTTGESPFKRNTRFTLGLGAVMLGGEANAFLNIYNNRPFQLKDQYYFWRYVNNENKAVRQIIAGKILPNPSSTIYNGINGVQITNTPTTFRRSFGTYTLSNKTEPGWLVELYVNNVLLNYTRADASGFFTFEVPMFYGNSNVRLRFYGPWGEEQSREMTLAIPFNFLPEHQFEYSLSAGIVEDGSGSKFSRAQFNYGVSKRMTIGGGMEYLSSVSKKTMPFINLSYRLGSSLFITGEHIHGVRTTGLIGYRFPGNLRMEFNYLRYEKDQNAIMVNYLEEKKLVLSKPFRGPKFSLYTRLTIDQFKLSTLPKLPKYTSTELLISSVLFGVSSNLTSYLIKNQAGIPLAYSNFSSTFMLSRGFHFLPQLQYEYTSGKFSFIKAEIEKSIFKRGFLNLSYQWDLKYKNYIVGAGLRFNFSFAQTSMWVRKTRETEVYNEMARGGIILDGKTNLFSMNNQSNVGRAGLTIAPYLDINGNGKRDKGEPAANDLKIRINGGRVHYQEKDTTIYISGLEAYTNYFIELDKNSFDNIAWQIRKPMIRINIDPNHLTYLEIPVAVLGEVSGRVYKKEDNAANGLGRILVSIFNSDSIKVASVLTESDGYFNYLGLIPGLYTVTVDVEQMQKLNMENISGITQVEIRKNKEGDTVTNLVFILQNKK